MSQRRGLVFVLSAPSGAGKSTLAQGIVVKDRRFRHPASYTTRSPRPLEKDRRDYCFVSRREFEKLRRKGCFLEHALVHGAYYGTPKKSVEKLLRAGQYVLLTIDVQGARAVQRFYPDECVSTFVLPPGRRIWLERLKKRGEKDLKVRLANAKAEISQISHYDYCLVNGDLKKTLADFFAIIRAEELKRSKSNARKSLLS